MTPPAAPPAASSRRAEERLSVTTLQCALRRIFDDLPPHRGLAESLRAIGEHVGAEYAVVHARLGVQPLSEEWASGEPDDALRESVTTTMFEVMSTGRARCIRLGGKAQPPAAIAAAVMYDEDLEQAGVAAILFRAADQQRALETLSLLESIVGFLGLLLATAAERQALDRDAFAVETNAAAEHPVRLAYHMAAELKNRHGLDMSAIGFVSGRRVNVVAICGMDEIRAANPGVKLIRAAMEECLDRKDAIVCPGATAVSPTEEDTEGDFRLHQQWSQAVGGDPVASFPLLLHDEVVAVVSVRHATPGSLRRAFVNKLARHMRDYGALVPLSRLASRSLLTHSLEVTRSGYRRFVGRGRRKAIVSVLTAVALLAWLLFGQLPYSFTVPCVVKAANQWVVACPRDGMLEDLYVRPGDIVQKGQLLAVLEAQEDRLRRVELKAELASLAAHSDRALADGDAGQVRIYEAQKRTVEAQLAVVEQSIERAQIRSPQPGVILKGNLRERLGGSLSMGEPLFEVARQDRMAVVLSVPEQLLLLTRDCQGISFSPSARPDLEYPLEELRIAPASTVQEQKNVFLCEATAVATPERLAPGMAGVGHLEVGYRPVWWVLTHRFVDWMRLNFWI